MAKSYELLVCPSCGYRWLTLGAAALSEAEALALVEEHQSRAHAGIRHPLDAFVPVPAPKKPRPPSRRSRG